MVLFLCAQALAAPSVRTFVFRYDVTVPAAQGTAPIELFVPVPRTDRQQRIDQVSMIGPVGGGFATEEVFGNRYWHATVPADATPATFRLSLRVQRRKHEVDPARAEPRPLTDAEQVRFSAALSASSLVPVGEGPILAELLSDVRAARVDASPGSTARAIFDWVSTKMEYKKTGTGWGNGDTFWACSSRYGNCTDFHSVFLSLARTEGIPALFEMGFPIPLDRSEGSIAGYHCWVKFWLPGVGWVPIDASEAAKHPERRGDYYGAHAADRVRFSTGRDLRLGAQHQGPALNYFVHPYAERQGKPWAVSAAYRYQEQ